MGKKKNRGGSSATKDESDAAKMQSNVSDIDTKKMPSHARRKLDGLVDELMRLCSVSRTEWDDYLKLYSNLQEIETLEKDYHLPAINRSEHFDDFLKWFSLQGAVHRNVEISSFEEVGYGIKAKQTLQENEMWLSVPKKAMLTTDSASKSTLGKLIEKDPLLQHMPNVCLALHLLNERCNENSLWAPYIAILPDDYDVPMYFTPEEMLHLKGSAILGEVIKQCINIARQYAYFYKLLRKVPKAATFHMSNRFTYDSYRRFNFLDIN